MSAVHSRGAVVYRRGDVDDIVHALIVATVRTSRLEAAIRAHREEVQCCARCGDDATAERRDADGELWALVEGS